jgi:hypothetical protein
MACVQASSSLAIIPSWPMSGFAGVWDGGAVVDSAEPNLAIWRLVGPSAPRLYPQHHPPCDGLGDSIGEERRPPERVGNGSASSNAPCSRLIDPYRGAQARCQRSRPRAAAC